MTTPLTGLLPAGSDLDPYDDLLSLLDASGVTPTESANPTPHKTYSGTFTPDLTGLQFDPLSGGFGHTSGGAAHPMTLGHAPDTYLEFPDPAIPWTLSVDYPSTDYQTPAGPFDLRLSFPSALLHLAALHGAKLDAQGLLAPDPDHPTVLFHLPKLTVKLARTADTGGAAASLVSADAGAGGGGADTYDFARMEPPYALVGPGAVFGFGFRSAVLDLSDTSTPGTPPTGVGPTWHGLWLPEARIFVSPHGMEDLAVDGGVRDLYVGLGSSSGVSGTFELEVINRGSDPAVSLRVQDDQGRSYAVDSAGECAAPEQVVVAADARGGLAPYTFAISSTDGSASTTDRLAVTVPASGAVAVTATVTDGMNHAGTATAHLSRLTTAIGATPGGTPATATGDRRLTITAQNSTSVTVALTGLPSGNGSTAWTWDGGGSVTGDTATIPVAAGATVGVSALRTFGVSASVDCYFRFDRPADRAGSPSDAEVSATPAAGRTSSASWQAPGGSFTLSTDAVPSGAAVTVTGYASYDGDDSARAKQYNLGLSGRRQQVLTSWIAAHRADLAVTQGTPNGFTASQAAGGDSSPWWRAGVDYTSPGPVTIAGTLARPAAPPPTAPTGDQQPAKPSRPDWFRKLGARVTLVQGTFVRCEVYGEFDVQTAAEDKIPGSGAYIGSGTDIGSTNSMDGVIDAVVRVVLDEATKSWEVDASLTAAAQDRDGLVQAKRPLGSGAHHALDTLGAYAALTPVLALAAPASPSGGDYVALALGAAAIGAFSSVLTAKTVTLRGGEIDVKDHDGVTEVVLLLDLETCFGFDATIVKVDVDKPITVRYKAVGLSFGWGGSQPFVLRPVFDANKGYTLDIPQGAVVAAGPLGDLLDVLGAKVSRDNPTYLEVEVGIGADLGIIHVDTVRVRMRLDQSEPPQLTALGASVDVPGVMSGRGYLAVDGDSIAGSLDVTITAVNVRICASLKVVTNPVTGVFIGLELDLPVPIVLGTTGIGIYGFLGAVGVNMHRVEDPSAAVPALAWLVDTEQGNPIGPQGWGGQAGAFAVAIGALVGTMDAGFILHLKGVLLLELPGPALLLMMRADLLSLPPALSDNKQQATFLAVVVLSPDGLTIGLQAEYDIVELVTIRVPLQAQFPATDPQGWSVDVGTWAQPVTVTVFTALSGSGYLMLHGDGIHLGSPPAALASALPGSGFSIAAGAHLSFVWGSVDAGLYLKIAGGFDVFISFSPFALAGQIELSGELRLFIISIGASAELDVHSGKQIVGGQEVSQTYVHGEICGEVDFFFFKVKGCVDFTLGDADPPPPTPAPLVSGVALISRSAALLLGSGTDRPIDGKLAQAQADTGPGPSVPLDAIAVVQFTVRPDLSATPAFTATTDAGPAVAGQAPGGPANPWVRRGRTWWRYVLSTVTLHGSLSAGGRPATWWHSAVSDRLAGTNLALLDWIPDPTPRAVPYGDQLGATLTERWGTVCLKGAEPAPVLWTFDDAAIGPSEGGWRLTGIPWPDEPDTLRSSPPPLRLTVTERWRCGETGTDRRRGITPARVVGGSVTCPRTTRASTGSLTQPDAHPATRVDPASFARLSAANAFPGVGVPDAALSVASAPPLPRLVSLVTTGTALSDLHAVLTTAVLTTAARATAVLTTMTPPLATGPVSNHGGEEPGSQGCAGQILRSPFGDGRDPIQLGDPAAGSDVKKGWYRRGFEPGPLVDAVEIRADGGLHSLTVLALVSRSILEGGCIARFLAPDGTELGRRPTSAADLFGAATAPPQWIDQSGPWYDPVQRAGRYGAQLTAQQGHVWVLMTLTVPAGTATVELGIDPARDTPPAKGPRVAPFYLAALSGVGMAEMLRSDYDTKSQAAEAAAAAVPPDVDDYALLVPGQGYTVEVAWTAYTMDQDAQPTIADQGTAAPPPGPQLFCFTADGPDGVPDRLDPWVLTTTPGPDERGVFCDDPVSLTLATQNVDALFAAYGDTLQLVLHAASGRHPNPDGTHTSGSMPVPVPFDPQVSSGALRILTPWSETMTEVAAALPCVEVSGTATGFPTATIPFALDERTDYLLDIERVAAGASPVRIFRFGFTTGQFRSLPAYATYLAGTRLRHRAVPNPTAFQGLSARPTGQAVDDAFVAAGLPMPQVPTSPEVTVLWSHDLVPQPVAVVLDAPDPLWRSRPLPTQDPVTHAWSAVVTDWLTLAASGAPVAQVVRAPGDQRALILLGSGARGTTLLLTLHRAGNPISGDPPLDVPCGSVTFTSAPWEDPEP